MNNISNLKEKVLIVIPIINNYKIFKDSFYNKNNLENRKSETISLVCALDVNPNTQKTDSNKAPIHLVNLLLITLVFG